MAEDVSGGAQSPAEEKAARTPAQRKIDSQLLQALGRRRGESRGVPAAPAELRLDAKGRALVDISADVTPRLIAKIRRRGGALVSQSESHKTVRARVRLEKLEALAALKEVRFIMPAAGATTN